MNASDANLNCESLGANFVLRAKCERVSQSHKDLVQKGPHPEKDLVQGTRSISSSRKGDYDDVILILVNQCNPLVTTLFVHCIVKWLIITLCGFPLQCVVKSWSFMVSRSLMVLVCMEHRQQISSTAVTQVLLEGHFQGSHTKVPTEVSHDHH
jgi:hypothetical protein